MRKIVSLFIVALFFLFCSNRTFAASWYYPMAKTLDRATLKGFGVLANDAFYKGREALFPTKFYGYHAGQDLETFQNEKEDNILVPFYAVTDGIIIYKGTLSGYGGVLLERLEDDRHVALYGHIKLPTNIQVGDKVTAGQLLSYLGNNFSAQTSGERKHLHFAIHKGTDEYFHGHEANLTVLHNEWEDPLPFLKALGAIEPGVAPANAKESSKPTVPQTRSIRTSSIFAQFLTFIRNLFKQ